MLGIQFIKLQPTEYVLQYTNGKLKREAQYPVIPGLIRDPEISN